MPNIDFNPDVSADFGGTSPSTVSPTNQDGGTSAPAAGTPISQQWTKLGIINEALINTANNTVTLPGDIDTDEYRVASSAFDQWLGITIYRRNWTFASLIKGLDRVGDSPWPGYADIFAKPADCMFFETCWRADLAALIQPALYGQPSEQYDTLPPPLDYAIIGDQVHTTVTDTTGLGTVIPQTPVVFTPGGDLSADYSTDFSSDQQAVTGGAPAQTIGLAGDFNEDFSSDFASQALIYCKYVPFPTLKTAFSVGFIAALRLKIEATLYRALNEDSTLAAWAEKASEVALQEAATRNDQEMPRKVAFRSRLIEARRRPRGGCGWR